MEWHHFSMFGPMGPADPNKFYRLFGHKKLENVIKLHGRIPSSFLMTANFRQEGQIWSLLEQRCSARTKLAFWYQSYAKFNQNEFESCLSKHQRHLNFERLRYRSVVTSNLVSSFFLFDTSSRAFPPIFLEDYVLICLHKWQYPWNFQG